MRINPELYIPQIKGESDKFSWNLYRLIKKHRNVRIMFYNESWFNKEHIGFNQKQSLDYRNVFIVFGNGIVDGYRISNIITSGAVLIDFLGMRDEEKFIDITEWLFKEYIRIGRCIFDREHDGWWQGGKGRYTSINKNSRKCNWCGKHFHREIQKETKVIRHETWVMEERT